MYVPTHLRLQLSNRNRRQTALLTLQSEETQYQYTAQKSEFCGVKEEDLNFLLRLPKLESLEIQGYRDLKVVAQLSDLKELTLGTIDPDQTPLNTGLSSSAKSPNCANSTNCTSMATLNAKIGSQRSAACPTWETSEYSRRLHTKSVVKQSNEFPNWRNSQNYVLTLM